MFEEINLQTFFSYFIEVSLHGKKKIYFNSFNPFLTSIMPLINSISLQNSL